MRNLLFLILTLIAFKSFGNGGPIDGSAVYKTGDIILINQPNIELEQEDLKIVIDGDYSIVNVTYQLKNKAYSASEITYGFPIQFIRNEVQYDLEWQDHYLPEIEFLLDGKPLEIKHQVDLSTEKVKADENHEFAIDMRKSWHVVDFTIEKGNTATLQVNYKVKNGYQDWASSKNFFPSFGQRKIFYDFSPAKKWGNGTVSNLKVEVDARSLVNNGGSVKVSGLEMANNSGIYSASLNIFNLEKAEDLTISYSNELEKTSGFIAEHRLSKDKIKSISTSSQLEGNYKASNMLDRDLKTAWVEGKEGYGIGEKIVIELDDYPLSAICLINGYTKSAGTYSTNSRIKKIRLEREIVSYNDPTVTSTESSEVVLDDLKYVELSDKNLAEMMSVIGDYGDGYTKVRKITLTILEVYEGSKYSDTCISEILLLGYQ